VLACRLGHGDGRLLGGRLDSGVQIRLPNYEKFSRVVRVVIAVPYYKERAYCGFPEGANR
jgi:hypothetical protein